MATAKVYGAKGRITESRKIRKKNKMLRSGRTTSLTKAKLPIPLAVGGSIHIHRNTHAHLHRITKIKTCKPVSFLALEPF